MKQLILLCTLIILILHASFAQENYQPGLIINLELDTIRGFIDYRNWSKNPGQVHFSLNHDAKPQTYDPAEIVEFQVLDEIYVGAVVEVEISPTKTNLLHTYPTLNIITENVFLQTLIRGSKSLCFYRNSDGKESFYIRKDTTFELLVYKKYLQKLPTKTVIQENKRYVGQLANYLKDCSHIQSKLVVTAYNRNSLERLFRHYHNCVGSEIDFQKKRERVNFKMGILVGASQSSINFGSKYFPTLQSTQLLRSDDVTAAVSLDMIFPRNQRKNSFYSEILYCSYTITGNYSNYVSSYSYSESTYEFAYSYLKINNMGRFKFPIAKINVFLSGGISNGYAVKETNLLTTTSYTFENPILSQRKAIDETRKYEQGVLLGAGLRYKSFSIEGRWEYSNGMSKLLSLGSKVTRYYVLCGYSF